MAKAKTNAGNANKSGAGKRATMTRTTKTTTTKRTPAKTAAKPAARTTARRAATKTAAKRTTQRARQEEGASARLTPIRKRQSPRQIIATVALRTGNKAATVKPIALALGEVYQRHLMKKGSGRVPIIGAGASLWRGREGARPARKMASPILKGRVVEIPARRAISVARIRVHSALREIVARA